MKNRYRSTTKPHTKCDSGVDVSTTATPNKNAHRLSDWAKRNVLKTQTLLNQGQQTQS